MTLRARFSAGPIPAILPLLICCFPCPGQSAERRIDAQQSTLVVRVYKAGVFGAFGHDHEIAAPVESGAVDEAARKVQLRARAGALRVRDPGTSEKDKAEIQKTMLGPQVLDAERFPEIAFRGTSAAPAGEGAWTVHGELTVHGQTRPVTVRVNGKEGHYTGSASFRQSEFGIQPVKIAGGTVKVKDEVRVEFDIRLAQ